MGYHEYFIKLPIGTRFKMLNDHWVNCKPGDIAEIAELNLRSDRISDKSWTLRLLKQDGVRYEDDTSHDCLGMTDDQIERMFRSLVCSRHF